jgi:hypothetical protein
MDRSEYYYDVVCNQVPAVSRIFDPTGQSPDPCQDLNKQFDCNKRTPTTRYYFDLNAQTGYAQALHSNVVAYNSEVSGKEIINNPMNIINKK